MKKELSIEELLLIKSRRDRARYHLRLFKEFLSSNTPDIYLVWTELNWLKAIVEQSTILIYIDARWQNSVDQIAQLLVDNPSRKFVIDHISELKEEQYALAQLFYHILDQQEYEYNGITIDFSRYSILMIQHDVENEYDDFYEYGRKKSVRL